MTEREGGPARPRRRARAERTPSTESITVPSMVGRHPLLSVLLSICIGLGFLLFCLVLIREIAFMEFSQ
jgi:hypothetical protein